MSSIPSCVTTLRSISQLFVPLSTSSRTTTTYLHGDERSRILSNFIFDLHVPRYVLYLLPDMAACFMFLKVGTYIMNFRVNSKLPFQCLTLDRDPRIKAVLHKMTFNYDQIKPSLPRALKKVCL